MTAPPDLTAFCERTHPQLVGALGLFCGDRKLAEDLAQDAMVRVCQRWTQVRQMQRPDAWLFTVAFNLARSHFRRGVVIRSAVRLLRAEADTDQSPLDQTAGHLDLMAALRTLPPKDRQLLVMRYYLGYSTAETAEALRLPTGTVRSRLSRATERIRPALSDRFAEEVQT